MTTIQSPDLAFIKQVVADIIGALDRDVVFHYVSSVEICPVCGGQDPFCGTCKGEPFLETLSTFTVGATVKWKLGVLPESKRYRSEGQYVQGDCQLVLAYDTTYVPILDATRKVVVDNRDCVLRGYYFRGEPEVNRIYVIVDEDARTDGAYRV